MKNFEESSIHKNQVEFEELEEAIFFKSFKWGSTTIDTLMKFIEELEDANIKYAILTSCKFRCQNIYISKKDKTRIPFELKISQD